jgi:hypothetical protein
MTISSLGAVTDFVHELNNVHTKSGFSVHVLKTYTRNRCFLCMKFQPY